MLTDSQYAANLEQHLRPVADLLCDEGVSEVMINGVQAVYFEKNGRLERAKVTFGSRRAVMSVVTAIAQFNGLHVNTEQPVLEGHLPDGSRIEAVLPPAAPLGPMICIRRFRKHNVTIDHLVRSGSLAPAAAQLLTTAARDKKNVLVSGGTGSGKTTLLNVLSGLAGAQERIVVIEDAQELQLQASHVVQMTARRGDPDGRGRVSVRDLFRATLRMRPDRIVIGEIRGGEALELVQAMTSGHGGCLSTIHANHPTDALARLESLALMSDVGIPLQALQPQIASAIDMVVQTVRRGDGSRGVSHICEVGGHHPSTGYELACAWSADQGAEHLR